MNGYQRTIFFTKSPLVGKYRYKDEFQIFPANLESMPKSQFQRHFPNILEYRIKEFDQVSFSSEKIESASLKELFSFTATTLTLQDRILDFLTAVSNNRFFRYKDSEGNWGMPMTKEEIDEEMNTWSSKWCMRMFHFPELPNQLRIESLTDNNIPTIVRENHKTFYTYNPSLDADTQQHIRLPDTIDELFDSYFSLSTIERNIMDGVISFLNSAIETFTMHKTLSLVAVFTSLETLMNLEFKDVSNERCEKCGQLKYSIAMKFREFLMKYIGDSQNNKKKFNSLYSLRSKIVHTGTQLRTEKLFADVPDEVQTEEYLKRAEVLQLGKLAFANWLLTKPYGVNKRRVIVKI